MPAAREDVAHLMRRAAFGARASELDALVKLDLDEIVDRLLDATPQTPARPEFLTPGKDPGSFMFDVTHWWIDQMATSTAPLAEKMALYWHGHFTSSQMKTSMEAMWQQNGLFRTHGLGSFESLAQNVAVGPAMLNYLDNDKNTKTRRNENFARELLELFLLGVDKYSQQDVVAVAKAWTGHGVSEDGSTYEFHAAEHDTSTKTFLGVSRNWDGPDIIHFLCTDSTQRRVVARHVIGRLWEFFAHPDPPESVLSALSNVFVSSNLDIKTLMRAMFLRPEFYSATAKNGHVRSPVEFLTAVARYTRKSTEQLRGAYFWGNWNTMGQSLFYPPGVNGWTGGRSWVSASAIWAKGNLVTSFAAADELRDVLADTSKRPVAEAVQLALTTFGIDRVSQNTRRAMEAEVAADRREGRNNERLTLIVMTLLSPEFQVA